MILRLSAVRAPFFKFILFACLSALSPSEAGATGWEESSIRVGATKRWCRLYVPEGAPDHAPLVIWLHGGTGSMYTTDEALGGFTGWVRLADKEKFILLAPNGTNAKTGNTRGRRQNWNDLRGDPSERQSKADDVGFLRALLELFPKDPRIDPNRIYVTGPSNGGEMTYRAVIELSDHFAAGAAFIANIPVNAVSLRSPSRPVPLLLWHGTRDPLMRYNGGEVAGRRGMMRSAGDTVAWWIQADRADPRNPQTEALPDLDPRDNCRIYRTRYPALPGGAPLLVYRSEGGGHTVATRYPVTTGPFVRMLVGPVCHDADGVELAWEFMKGFSLSMK